MLPDVTVLSFSSPLLRAELRLVRGCFLSGLASTGAALRGFTGWGLQRQKGGELRGGEGGVAVSAWPPDLMKSWCPQGTASCAPQPTSFNPARTSGLPTLCLHQSSPAPRLLYFLSFPAVETVRMLGLNWWSFLAITSLCWGLTTSLGTGLQTLLDLDRPPLTTLPRAGGLTTAFSFELLTLRSSQANTSVLLAQAK